MKKDIKPGTRRFLLLKKEKLRQDLLEFEERRKAKQFIVQAEELARMIELVSDVPPHLSHSEKDISDARRKAMEAQIHKILGEGTCELKF